MKIVNSQFLDELCEAALDGEPVMIIRAQDMLSPGAIEDYKARAISSGAKNVIRVTRKLARFIEWQKNNPNRIKLPD